MRWSFYHFKTQAATESAQDFAVVAFLPGVSFYSLVCLGYCTRGRGGVAFLAPSPTWQEHGGRRREESFSPKILCICFAVCLLICLFSFWMDTLFSCSVPFILKVTDWKILTKRKPLDNGYGRSFVVLITSFVKYQWILIPKFKNRFRYFRIKRSADKKKPTTTTAASTCCQFFSREFVFEIFRFSVSWCFTTMSSCQLQSVGGELVEFWWSKLTGNVKQVKDAGRPTH